MLLRFQDIEIPPPPENPFDADELGCREEEAELLTHLISSIDHPFVLAISARWGTGKSTFLRMWKQYLEVKKGFTCLSFNAWESDFVADPLVAFIGEMQAALNAKSLTSEQKEAASERIKKLRATGQVFLKHGLPAILKMATLAAIDVDKIEDTWADAVKDATSDFTTDLFKDYEEEKKSLEVFRQNMTEFTRLLSAESGTPLVFFIDELDRCRPTFALELLERIQHLFNVENVIFILALSMNQLYSSVKSIYGQGTDPVNYLRKFIDLEYRLRNPSVEAYSSILFRELKIGGDPASEGFKYIAGTFADLCDVFQLSLRECQQVAVRLRIALLLVNQASRQRYPFLIFLTMLYEKERTQFEKFASRDRAIEQKTAEYHYKLRQINEEAGVWLRAAIETFFVDDNDILKYEREIEINLERERSSRNYTPAHSLSMARAYWLRPNSERPFIVSAPKKIAFLENFQINP